MYAWILALSFTLNATAQSPDAGQKLLKEIELTYQEKKGFEADFVQKRTKALTGLETTSEGHLQAQIPGKFRWEVLSPQKSLAVSNGFKIWVVQFMGANEPEQVLEESTKNSQTKLIQDLLAAQFSRIKSLQVRLLDPNTLELTAQPKDLPDVETLRIQRSTSDLKHIEKMWLFHRNKDQTTLEFKQFKFKNSFTPQEFIYIASPHARKIRANR